MWLRLPSCSLVFSRPSFLRMTCELQDVFKMDLRPLSAPSFALSPRPVSACLATVQRRLPRIVQCEEHEQHPRIIPTKLGHDAGDEDGVSDKRLGRYSGALRDRGRFVAHFQLVRHPWRPAESASHDAERMAPLPQGVPHPPARQAHSRPILTGRVRHCVMSHAAHPCCIRHMLQT